MMDLISRQVAIDALMPIYKTASTRNRNVFSVARKCLETIENLPSAEPKKGNWVHAKEEHGYVCPFCNEYFCKVGIWNFNFCPNCGADMREE